MTQLHYFRLPTTEDDPECDVEIQMPAEPKRTAIWKFVVPCVFLLVIFFIFTDVLSCNIFPKRFMNELSKMRSSEILAREAIESLQLDKLEKHTSVKYNEQNKTTTTSMQSTESSIVFRKRHEVAHVDCARLLRDDKQYMKEVAKKRPKLVEDVKLNMSCEAIKERILPARNPDTGFPILYARIVHTNYEFLEDQLATNYANENVYCFSIDKKADRSFHERFFTLQKCLPNVVVAKKEETVDSAGHNQNEAHFHCMRAVRDRKWNYVMTLQNHDVMIKTHQEMTEILKIYGGANDMEIAHCPDGRCVSSLEKNMGKLDLCPKNLNETELGKCESTDLQWGKGLMEALLSRAAIEYIFDQLNIIPLMKELNDMGYGVDEELFQTLQINPEVRLPGGFHTKCRDKSAQSISRLTYWGTAYYGLWKYILTVWRWSGNGNDCPSGKLRHGICIYGVEDLPLLAATKFVMANKMMPDFDQAVTSCVSEMLFNRTRDGSNIDRKYYENINAVRYHHERNKPGFNIDNFRCEL